MKASKEELLKKEELPKKEFEILVDIYNQTFDYFKSIGFLEHEKFQKISLT